MKKADKSISLTHILVPFFFFYNALGASAELVMISFLYCKYKFSMILCVLYCNIENIFCKIVGREL